MNRIGLGLVALTFAAFGCQNDQRALNQKLDEINKRLVVIESKIGQGGGAVASAGAAARQPAQPRAQPNPAHVYSVPVANSAIVGPKHAKVTVVEAFTFT